MMGETIIRQAALDALRTMQTYKMFEGDDVLLIDQAGAMTELMLLPPAEPKRGKWVLVCDNNGMHFICDKCGAWRYYQEQNFCGECGADMRGERNDAQNI